MPKIQTIGVYCSSRDKLEEVYQKAAMELGEELARHKLTMIYGGGAQGLMGVVSESAMAHGGRVIGFMPHHLKTFEGANSGITELHLVDTMHIRKQLMFEHSDAFLVLPGGFGTLDESFELITWRQLKLHEKPIIFVNINEYWAPLKDLTENIFNQHFAYIEDKRYFMFVDSVREAIHTLLKASEPPLL